MCQSSKPMGPLAMEGKCCEPCECGCCPPFRSHYSSKEKRDCLEIYRDQLKKELAGVEERISGMEV